MYGQGNYAPPFGQGPQRPLPPYQQPSTGHPPPGPQQARPPFAMPPGPSTYPHPPRFPPNLAQAAPPVSLPSSGNSYMHPPNVHHGPSFQHPYSAPQQNHTSGTQNPNHVSPLPPPPPRLPPPPPMHGQVVYGVQVHQPPPVPPQGVHHMPLQPPLPPGAANSFHPFNTDSAKQPSIAESQIPSMPPPPPPLPPSSPPKPPPPPSCSSPAPSENLPSIPVNAADSTPVHSGNGSCSVQVSASELTVHSAINSHNRDDVPASNEPSSLRQSVVLDLPLPPPKPADEKMVRNIEVLCQFITKNGPGFEEMARQNEVGNPDFIFLFGGEPGSEASCAHEYYLWMKKKCGIVSNSHVVEGEKDMSQRQGDTGCSGNTTTTTVVGATQSPVDSDVDMEDDITQSEKELGVHNSGEYLELEPVSAGDMLEMQKQDNDLHESRESTPAQNLGQMLNQPAKLEQSCGQADDIDSPIRLIQNYASDDSSDDDGVPCDEPAKTTVISSLSKLQSTSSHEDVINDNITSKSGQLSEVAVDECAPECNESLSTKDQDNFDPVRSDAEEKAYKDGKLASSPNAATQGKYASENSMNDSSLKEIVKEHKKNASSEVKVDEFGRLVKKGVSDSESDDSYQVRRNKKGRSRSRSRSPSDRRRRRSPRRSPRRRKDRRSRSQSWSPRRRSRSKSPYKHGDHIGSEKSRRDYVQIRECFDYLKGRCYRGASCRYVHHDVGRNQSSRHYKSQQHQPEVMASSRKSGFHGGYVSSRLTEQSNDVKGEKMNTHCDEHDKGDLASKSNNQMSIAESMHDNMQPSLFHKDDEAIVTNGRKGEVFAVGDSQLQGSSSEPSYHENVISDLPSTNEQVIHHSHAEASVQTHRRPDGEPPVIDGATNVNSSSIQSPPVSTHEVHVSEMSDIPAVSNDASPQTHIPHLPPPPPVLSQAASGPEVSDQVAHKSVAFGYPPQSLPVGNIPGYQAPLSNQQTQYPIPPNPSWNIMPPMQLRPPYVTEPSMPGTSLPFQQGNLSLRPHPVEWPIHSQVGGFQHQPYPLHLSNLPTQPFGGVREDRYSQFLSQGVTPSSSFASASVPPQPIPFPGDSTVKNMPSFPGGSLPFSEPPKPPTFQNHVYSSHLGDPLAVSGYSSDPLERDSSRLIGIGGSKIPAHYNPYASTFDQPLTTRFSSSAFTHEREAGSGSKFESSFKLGHATAGQTSGDSGLNKIILSPNSSRARAQNLPKSGEDQYDPLFDSIEPSSGSFKKHVHKRDHVAGNSDKMKNLSGHFKVLDVEENNKQKEGGVVAANMSLENDEFGETADAEVGAVENGSPSEPDEDAIMAEGEIEIDQVRSEGKSKKSKDSRSMKLFKIAVANFVKEVLKPQWRQGNMSKEVFKTIVKKTVDKVSGAMKNHRMPKSQAKIDHYIDSSRRKLTQLVEGYVSKYKS